jgi:hypothetical protein
MKDLTLFFVALSLVRHQRIGSGDWPFSRKQSGVLVLLRIIL